MFDMGNSATSQVSRRRGPLSVRQLREGAVVDREGSTSAPVESFFGVPTLTGVASETSARGGVMAQILSVNEHVVDRVLRVGLGVALIGLAVAGSIGVWGYVGVVPLLTGLAGTCPVYSLLGVSTCNIRKT